MTLHLLITIFAGFILFLFGVFIVPNLKGRSLEEVDELFGAGLKWGWQFSRYHTAGTGAKIAALEKEDHDGVRKLSVSAGVHKEKSVSLRQSVIDNTRTDLIQAISNGFDA